MTIEEIREARIKAQEEIRELLWNLADRTGLGVVAMETYVIKRTMNTDRPEYVVADVRIEMESP